MSDPEHVSALGAKGPQCEMDGKIKLLGSRLFVSVIILAGASSTAGRVRRTSKRGLISLGCEVIIFYSPS